jgi:hypothetical protein
MLISDATKRFKVYSKNSYKFEKFWK